MLSDEHSDTEAAVNLFKTLRTLDKKGHAGIVALKGSDKGMGLALNDRLRRAAGRG